MKLVCRLKQQQQKNRCSLRLSNMPQVTQLVTECSKLHVCVSLILNYLALHYSQIPCVRISFVRNEEGKKIIWKDFRFFPAFWRLSYQYHKLNNDTVYPEGSIFIYVVYLDSVIYESLMARNNLTLKGIVTRGRMREGSDSLIVLHASFVLYSIKIYNQL